MLYRTAIYRGSIVHEYYTAEFVNASANASFCYFAFDYVIILGLVQIASFNKLDAPRCVEYICASVVPTRDRTQG